MSAIIPMLGSIGYYEFLSPFDTLSSAGVQYECMAIRKLSEYRAANEDPESLIYKAYGIASYYEAHTTEDIAIISLRSRKGHWLYVPASFITAYPTVNGITYRGIMIGMALNEAIPAEEDLSPILSDLKSMAESSLGIAVKINVVEITKPTQVPHATHVLAKASRVARLSRQSSLYLQNQKLRRENEVLLLKVKELEEYLLAQTP